STMRPTSSWKRPSHTGPKYTFHRPSSNFFEANLEIGKQVTDVHPARVPADPAVAADQPALVLAGVDQRLKPRAVRTCRRGIAARRRRVAERLVGPLGVVALAEASEAARLRGPVGLRRGGGRGPQG